jgi:hypothetical protein
VKSGGIGRLILSNEILKGGNSSSLDATHKAMNSLTITDSKGLSQELYFGPVDDLDLLEKT